jgi:hypothetical protein
MSECVEGDTVDLALLTATATAIREGAGKETGT